MDVLATRAFFLMIYNSCELNLYISVIQIFVFCTCAQNLRTPCIYFKSTKEVIPEPKINKTEQSNNVSYAKAKISKAAFVL